MSATGTRAGAYCRLTEGERERAESLLPDGIAALRRLLPLGPTRFERRLGRALAKAERGEGFHLGGFAARRALGGDLVVDIDPANLQGRLEHRFKHAGQVYNIRDKFIGAGDWSPLLRSLERSSTHREVAEIVQAGFEYRKTPSYARALDRAAGARPIKRNFVTMSSPAKVEAYFRQTAEMCRSMQRCGLVRRRDYGWRLASFANPSVRMPWIEFGETEVGVAIGAAGDLYRFASGKHRTAAALALGLASIPVEIRLVHAEWLSGLMAETGLPPVDALRRGIETLPLTRR